MTVSAWVYIIYYIYYVYYISGWGHWWSLPAINHGDRMMRAIQLVAVTHTPDTDCSTKKRCLKISIQKEIGDLFSFFPPSVHRWVVQLKPKLSYHCHIGKQVWSNGFLNKLAKLRRHTSRVHFASNSFGPIHTVRFRTFQALYSWVWTLSTSMSATLSTFMSATMSN